MTMRRLGHDETPCDRLTDDIFKALVVDLKDEDMLVRRKAKWALSCLDGRVNFSNDVKALMARIDLEEKEEEERILNDDD